MKTFKKVLSTLALTFIMSACSTTPSQPKLDWNDYKNYGQGIDAQSEKFKNYNLDFDKEAFEKAKKAADDAVANKNLGEFNRQAEKALSLFSGVRGKTVVARAKYYASGDSADKKVYEDLYDVYLGFYSWYYGFLNNVNNSTKEIRDSFFEGMSEAEITEYINGFYYTEETKQLDSEITAIQDAQEERYNKFGREVSNAKTAAAWKTYMNNYISDSLNNFRSVVEKGNRYAELYGYKDYLDYTYAEYYHRDYSYDFVEQYAPLIEQYVLPLITEYESAGSSQVLSNTRLLECLQEQNFCYEPYFLGDTIDAYMERMGGSMTKAYDHFKSDGYYCFTTNSKSLGTAYVTSIEDGEPIIFFSSNYQTASTFVHEFGHYTVAYSNPNSSSFPFDIEETHSQSNEMLFSLFLQEYYKDSPNLDVYQFAAKEKVYDLLTDIALTFATAEAETYVFENIDKKNSEILEGVEAIWDKYYDKNDYGFFDSMYYWCTPAVSATGYYVSYATSGIASLGVYAQGCEDFNKAKDNYLKLVDYPNEDYSIKAFFDYSGLYSPLEESTFQKLQNIFSL